MDIKTDSRIPFFADLSVPVFHLAGENTRFRPPGRELLLHLGSNNLRNNYAKMASRWTALRSAIYGYEIL